MKREKNLFHMIYNIHNIHRAFRKALEHKAETISIKRIKSNLNYEMDKIHESLIHKTFTSSKYTHKTIREPKERELSILPFYPDRIVHHALLNVVSPIFIKRFITDTYCCIPNRGIHVASKKCLKLCKTYRYCRQYDISKFYHNIHHDILMEFIRNIIGCSDTLWLIEDIVRSTRYETGNVGLPIGNVTSQWFGNIYMNEFDHIIKDRLRIKGYLRYCDDFIIFVNTKQELREYDVVIQDYITNVLKMHFSKNIVKKTKDGIDFCGYIMYSSGKVLLRKRTKRRFLKVINKIRNNIDMNPNDLKYIKHALFQLNSYKGWMSHANSHALCEKLQLKEIIMFLKRRVDGDMKLINLDDIADFDFDSEYEYDLELNNIDSPIKVELRKFFDKPLHIYHIDYKKRGSYTIKGNPKQKAPKLTIYFRVLDVDSSDNVVEHDTCFYCNTSSQVLISYLVKSHREDDIYIEDNDAYIVINRDKNSNYKLSSVKEWFKNR